MCCIDQSLGVRVISWQQFPFEKFSLIGTNKATTWLSLGSHQTCHSTVTLTATFTTVPYTLTAGRNTPPPQHLLVELSHLNTCLQWKDGLVANMHIKENPLQDVLWWYSLTGCHHAAAPTASVLQGVGMDQVSPDEAPCQKKALNLLGSTNIFSYEIEQQQSAAQDNWQSPLWCTSCRHRKTNTRADSNSPVHHCSH